MFQRDYILRLVEQLAKTLGAVLTFKKARRFAEAELTIAEAARNLVGLDIETLLALPIDQVVAMLNPGGVLDAGKCLVVAELLRESGAVRRVQGDDHTADLCRVRALALLLEVSGREGLERVPDPGRYRAQIDELLQDHQPSQPIDVRKRLLRHYEREGAYAEAEDVLFELVDEGHQEIIIAGIEFYERLMSKSDDELASGKLPRDEVEEGLSQLRARENAQTS